MCENRDRDVVGTRLGNLKVLGSNFASKYFGTFGVH